MNEQFKYMTLMHAYNTMGDFPLHMETAIKDILYKSYNDTEVVYPMIAKTETSTTDRNRYMGLYNTPLDLAQLMPLEPFPDASIAEAGSTIYNHKYGRVISFPFELIEDDIKNAFSDIPAKFGRGYRYTIEKAVIDTLTNSTNYSAVRGNLVQTNLALSYAGLKEAYDLFTVQRGPDGELINIFPDTLLCHPMQFWTINEVLAPTLINVTQPVLSSTATSTGPTNIVNPLINGERRFKVVYSPFLPNKYSWYLFKANSELILQNRTALEVRTTTRDSQQMFDRDAYAIRARCRFGTGMNDYRWFVYSPGA